MRKIILGAFLFTAFASCAFAIESSNEDDPVKRSQGCKVAYKISKGTMTLGQMTVEETISYNYLRSFYPEEFQNCSAKRPQETSPSVSQSVSTPFQGKVTYVVEGNTFALATGEKFNLIGIRILDGKNEEAKAYLKKTVQGQEVRLYYDREPKDKYGRLQGVAYLGKELVNKQLIDAGLAAFKSAPPNTGFDYLLQPRPASDAADFSGEISSEEEMAQQIQQRQSRFLFMTWGSVLLALVVGIIFRKMLGR
jgi:endonuclease YncB( thermonuclease family)